MTKRMLIDATHAEETRVVVLDGNRLEDFDVETSTKKQLKGNIYLAKVVRVEPSLQAAFVEYGGGRHGFLAFGEIHPDYYQIPVADRQRLLAMQAEEARAEAEAEEAEVAEETRAEEGRDRDGRGREGRDRDGRDRDDRGGDDRRRGQGRRRRRGGRGQNEENTEASGETSSDGETPEGREEAAALAVHYNEVTYGAFEPDLDAPPAPVAEAPAVEPEAAHAPIEAEPVDAEPVADGAGFTADDQPDLPEFDGYDEGADIEGGEADLPPPEAIGGDSDVFEGNGAEEARARREARFLRNYRIQEVIRRRQIMLVQVVKEERGTKGAALTTYISLAGRFCVLMPNSPRGGGISRKITSASDRRRLKEITAELEIPQGMGLIVRTAGAARPKPEIKRDCEYLMRLWDEIRENTMQSMAPALIHEEANLIKRAIRDGYSRDIDEVLVDGPDGWKAAHDFMRMLMPSHARKVIQWRESEAGGQTLFARMGVEAQLDGMLSPTVQLRSGGYLVINQAEALVAIDVNSGRATRERNIEETALRTNMEAAEEAARQLRLRDLAGLIVIDFIDMESRRHNAMVERKLKDALKNDRARIQVGHISHFGLLEMSRQRLRPSLTETNFVTCPHCNGFGHVRSVESSAMHVMRAIEDEGARGRSALIEVRVAGAVAMYLLNHKRDRLAEIEARTGMRVHFAADETLVSPNLRMERLRALEPGMRPVLPPPVAAPSPPFEDDEVEEEAAVETEEAAEAPRETQPRETSAREAGPRQDASRDEEDGERRRRRRRRRGGRREDQDAAPGETEGALVGDGEADEPALSHSETIAAIEADLDASVVPEAEPADEASASGDDDEAGRNRRRGRRGGRRRRRDGSEVEATTAAPMPPPIEHDADPFVAPPPPAASSYNGPTPADPFGGQPILDIFDIMDQQEQAQQSAPRAPARQAAIIDPPMDEPETIRAPAPPAPAPVPVPVPVAVAAPEPVVEAAPAAPVPAPAEPEAPAEPVVGTVIKPVVLGQDVVPNAAPRRGWWKR